MAQLARNADEKKAHKETGNPKKERLWTGQFLFLILVSFITAVGFNMVYTMIVDYSKNTLGAGLTVSGVIAGIFSITALCIRPFAGAASDRFNIKWICVFATILIALSSVGYALVPDVSSMLVMRILHGAAFGVSGTANIALVSTCIPRSRMGEGLGFYGLGQVFAQAVGPGMGAAIQEAFGYRTLFFLIAGLTAVGVILLIQFPYKNQETAEKEAEREKTDSKKSRFSWRGLIAMDVAVFALIGGLFSFANGIVNSFLKIFCDERHIAGYMSFFTVSAVVLFGMRLLIGRLADKSGLTWIVNLSLLASIGAMVLIGRATILPMILAAAVLKAAGQGGGQISLQAECIKKAGPLRSGVAASTFYIGADIGQGVGPVIGGAISSAWGYEAAFWMTAAILAAGILVFNVYQKRESLFPSLQKRTEPEHAPSLAEEG
jgi:predicted MFS family arabinose efflux permease